MGKHNHVSVHVVGKDGNQAHVEIYDGRSVGAQLITAIQRVTGIYEPELKRESATAEALSRLFEETGLARAFDPLRRALNLVEVRPADGVAVSVETFDHAPWARPLAWDDSHAGAVDPDVDSPTAMLVHFDHLIEADQEDVLAFVRTMRWPVKDDGTYTHLGAAGRPTPEEIADLDLVEQTSAAADASNHVLIEGITGIATGSMFDEVDSDFDIATRVTAVVPFSGQAEMEAHRSRRDGNDETTAFDRF